MSTTTTTISVRLTQDERAALEARAAQRGDDLTVYVRRTLLRAAGLPHGDTAAHRRMGRPRKIAQAIAE